MAENYRAITPEVIETRVDDEGRHHFVAKVCSYNVADSYNTSWAPGVFKRSLENKLPKAVFAHDDKRIIGKVVSYIDSDDGLTVDVRMSDFTDNPDARRVYAHLRDGELDEMSFWFKSEIGEPDPNLRGVTRFTSADLIEISPVLKGSIPGTKLLSVREEERTALDTQDMKSFVPVVQPGLPKNMKRVPHPYVATNGDGSVCKTCGAQADIKAHVSRGDSATHLRDLSITLASDPIADPGEDPNALISAADECLDAALGLASYQDVTNLPAWVVQVLALVLAADSSLDEAMDLLSIPDPDEPADEVVRSIDLSAKPKVMEPLPPSPDDSALLERLAILNKRRNVK